MCGEVVRVDFPKRAFSFVLIRVLPQAVTFAQVFDADELSFRMERAVMISFLFDYLVCCERCDALRRVTRGHSAQACAISAQVQP